MRYTVWVIISLFLVLDLKAQNILRTVTYEIEGGKAVVSLVSDKNLKDFQKLDPTKDQQIQLTVKVKWEHKASKKYILLGSAHVGVKVNGKKKGSIKVTYDKFTKSTPILVSFSQPYAQQKGEIIIDPHYLLNTENVNGGKRAKGKVIAIPYAFIRNTKKEKPKKNKKTKKDSTKTIKTDSLKKQRRKLSVATYSITPSWSGASNGMIELDLIGGKPPYFYQVKSLDISDTLHREDNRIVLEELSNGIYKIEIYDNAGAKIIFEKEVKAVGTPPEKEKKVTAKKSHWKIWISILWLILLIVAPIYFYRKRIKKFWEKTKINTIKKNTKKENTQKTNFWTDKIKIRKRS